MLSKEFLLEYVQKNNWISVGDKLEIGLADHYFDRLKDKGFNRVTDRGQYSVMTHSQILPSIEKLVTSPGMMKKMRRIPLGHQFYVVDHSNHVVLGLRRQMDQNGKMRNIMGTVLTTLNDGSTPRISKDREACEVIGMP